MNAKYIRWIIAALVIIIVLLALIFFNTSSGTGNMNRMIRPKGMGSFGKQPGISGMDIRQDVNRSGGGAVGIDGPPQF